jgi:uncharacterized membrane protein YheB (UPF0754 family)
MQYLPYLKYALAPLIGALIGWITNYLAVKMLFHPRKPVNLLLFRVQGIFPKRQAALARNLGTLVEEELLSHSDVTAIIHDPAFQARFRDLTEGYVERLLTEKLTALNPMIAMFLKDSMAEKAKRLIMEELDSLVPEVIEHAAKEIEERLDFGDLVRQKIENFSMDELERMLFAIMRQEFRFIELVGALLGFMIGLVQAALFAL